MERTQLYAAGVEHERDETVKASEAAMLALEIANSKLNNRTSQRRPPHHCLLPKAMLNSV